MKKQIARILTAALLTAALPLTAYARSASRKGTEGAPSESVTVTAEMIRSDANKKHDTGEPVPWDPDALSGKTFSILGDSISTYRNISNRAGSRWSNTTIGKGSAWYSDLKPVMEDTDTWWMQAAEDLNLRLLVNNSWSGSMLFQTKAKTKGAYAERCVQLHDNTGINDGAEPDIIIIFLGTNDFRVFPKLLGTSDIDYSDLFPSNGSGTQTWREPTTALEATAIILHRIRERYPLAEVYMMELLYQADLNESREEILRQFKLGLETVAEHFGAVTIHVPEGILTKETAELYFQDGRLHPNRLGMDVITEAVKKAVLENTQWKTETYYKVSLELDGVLADYGTDKLVRAGQPFSVVMTTEEGKTISVHVTADGEDITEAVYADGTVSIQTVNCDVTITATSA